MKEELLKKWLNDELTPEELESFKALDDYHSYAKIIEHAQYFKAPDFDQEESLEGLKFAINSRKKSSNKTILQLVASIAAILIIGFFVFRYAFTANNVESFKTTLAKTEIIELPDQSQVNLNSNSKLSYNSKTWETKRQLKLDGEALFKVKKGERFIVETDYGKVQVLGTVFNVKSRDYIFEVSCFEGSVEVKIDEKTFIVKRNDKLAFENSEVVVSLLEKNNPDWKNRQSIFDSKPLVFVLEEFKNYYDVKFDTSQVDTSKIFTGSFSHENLEIALNSITLPLGLSYRIDGNMVLLASK